MSSWNINGHEKINYFIWKWDKFKYFLETLLWTWSYCSWSIQLPMQSVPITTNVVSLNLSRARCTQYNIMIKFIGNLRQVFSAGSLVSSINKTDSHDTAEILLKVALNHHNLLHHETYWIQIDKKKKYYLI